MCMFMGFKFPGLDSTMAAFSLWYKGGDVTCDIKNEFEGTCAVDKGA